ncbi:MAG TPA: 3-hydroxybutyryl-CoA dehydrogenase [Stellaceae bacterium]|nr:3-hydroxybutyryl-CoA dehydrogenase [Stellaceae bacterium]
MAIRAIAVIGAGAMGSGIAQVAAVVGLGVTLIEVSDAAVEKGLDRVRGNLQKLVAKGKMTQPDKEAALGSIRGTSALEDLAPADVVIEAVTENYDVKLDLLERVDALVRAETIIASNTSSISITKLAAAISHPDRFIGMHFFNPVPVMALVEIVRGLQTSDATHDIAEALALQLGKSPITVKSGPGFLVNRILLPMINEAFFVLAEGDASATEIDEGMKLGCNHPIGPLALADLIGLDVLLAVMQTIHDEFGDSKYRPCPLLKEMVAAGYLGRKTRRGVYRY